MSYPNFFVETLLSNVVVAGSRDWVVIRVRLSHEGKALMVELMSL